MRKFMVSCIDNKTGYQMILSECTYNMACDWLEKELAKTGYEIGGVSCNRETGFTELYSGKPTKDSLNLKRKYFYDEQRGYLLGE